MTLTAMGRDLHSRRRALGLTQAGLAEAVGTRPVMVGRWERGEALPTLTEAVRLAEVLDLDPAVAANWNAVALRPGSASGPEPGEPHAGSDALSRPRSRWPSRLWGLVTVRRAGGRAAGEAEENAVFPTPRPRLPGESYLDDPVEQRRYFIRWALTLLALAALAVALVWALGELRQGWGAFLDLFRARPPGSGLTRALLWVLPA